MYTDQLPPPSPPLPDSGSRPESAPHPSGPLSGPTPVTVAVADMTAKLASAAPGQTVLVFVGSGQQLGLVGGVTYEHPIAITALPATGVAALLASSRLNQSMSAAETGQLVAASDLALGFPAIQIAVDPSDRYSHPDHDVILPGLVGSHRSCHGPAMHMVVSLRYTWTAAYSSM